MTGGPRILVVSPVPSHPPVQGNSVRILALASELMTRGIEMDFLYYGMEGLGKEQAEAMIAYWNRFHFLRSSPHGRPSHGSYWGLDDWCPDALCETVRSLLAERRYDAVLVNYVWMSRVLEGVSGPLKILDTHDLFGDRHLMAEKQGLEPRWFFTAAEEENRGFARADVVIGIQSAESAAIRKRHEGEVITVGHPMSPLFLLREQQAAPSFTFGYIGSGNPWNVRSVHAIDAALATRGAARWALGGTICRRPLQLRSQPYLVGVVDRVESFYDIVECVLNPMLGGTGLKVKTIEALAFGRPVIGTRDAFEGMDAEHPFHRLADTDGMVDAMTSYAGSRSLREEVALASRSLFFRYMTHVSEGYDRLETLIRARFRHRLPREASDAPPAEAPRIDAAA